MPPNSWDSSLKWSSKQINKLLIKMGTQFSQKAGKFLLKRDRFLINSRKLYFHKSKVSFLYISLLDFKLFPITFFRDNYFFFFCFLSRICAGDMEFQEGKKSLINQSVLFVCNKSQNFIHHLMAYSYIVLNENITQQM